MKGPTMNRDALTAHAPGCYGMILDHKSIPTCISCNVIDQCRSSAKKTLLSLNELEDFSDHLKFFVDIDEGVDNGAVDILTCAVMAT